MVGEPDRKRKLAAFWKKTSAKGNEYYTGKAENGVKLVIFVHTEKKNPKGPDLTLWQSDTQDGDIPF